MLAPETIEQGLTQIDPAARALLELAYRRGLPDAEIAGLSGAEEAQVRERRGRAELELADVLDADPGELRATLPALGPAAGPVPVDEDKQAQAGPSRRRWVTAAVGGLAVAVAVALVLALTRDDNAGRSGAVTDNPVVAGARTAAAGGAATIRHGRRLAFQRLNGTNGRGSAQLSLARGAVRLRVRVRGLLAPRGGGYAVWLYNSPQDARGLAATAQTSFDLSLALPRGYRRYRYVDVSREADTRPAHSALSLLRVPLARLEVR